MDNSNNFIGIHETIRLHNHLNDKIIDNWVESGLDLNIRDEEGNTPLMTAISLAKLDIAIILANRGADLTARNNRGETALLVAMTPDYKGSIHPHTALKLIEIDSDIVNENLPENLGGYTPLILAIVNGNDYVLDILIEKGAYLDAKANNGLTALMIASGHGKIEAVSKLQSYRVQLDNQDDNGNTALHMASAAGYHDIIEMLIDAGADQHITNEDGLTYKDIENQSHIISNLF